MLAVTFSISKTPLSILEINIRGKHFHFRTSLLCVWLVVEDGVTWGSGNVFEFGKFLGGCV